jgi:hypothetical protein
VGKGALRRAHHPYSNLGIEWLGTSPDAFASGVFAHPTVYRFREVLRAAERFVVVRLRVAAAFFAECERAAAGRLAEALPPIRPPFFAETLVSGTPRPDGGGTALWIFESASVYSMTISPVMPSSAWDLPSLVFTSQRRSPARPAAIGTSHHSAGLSRIDLDLADRAFELGERNRFAVLDLRHLYLAREHHLRERMRGEVMRIAARIAQDQACRACPSRTAVASARIRACRADVSFMRSPGNSLLKQDITRLCNCE